MLISDYDISLLSQKLFATYDPQSPSGSLADQTASLLEQQKNTWTQLAEGYGALASVRTREIRCEGFSVRTQFNPKRIVSSGANVDAKSISERKCFLCVENLPEAQKGILYSDEFLVLCNPAPIFPKHFTISNVSHIPQEIERFIGTMLQLAKDLGPSFSVFYNGPKCGASAPDHMHFQACPADIIPVEMDSENAERKLLRKKTASVFCFTLRNYGREVIILESGGRTELGAFLSKLLGAMKSVMGVSEEPMLNMICSFRKGNWRVIVFPRSKHRPDVFFREGEAKVLISPASVDIGGLVITPVEKDFQRVDAAMIENIFKEVSVSPNILEKIIMAL